MRVLGHMSSLTSPSPVLMRSESRLSKMVRWLALLLLCSAYLQGALCKLFDLQSARTEMVHFGLEPPLAFALVVIVFELVASFMILSGRGRWIGALALAAFTFAANFFANAFWTMPPPGNMMAANGFFEHLGLVGGFTYVALNDLRDRPVSRRKLSV